MGFLASVFEPKIHGVNCSYAEWQQRLQDAVLGSLQDEEEYGYPCFDWDDLRRDYPQLTFREFVIACGRVAPRRPEIER